MTTEPQSIEVEVVEIDGGMPPATVSGWDDSLPSQPDSVCWQGVVRTLDRRWWPLWIFLGIGVVSLLVAVGLLLALLFMIFKLFSRIVRLIFR
jgi:hypothetical protein